MGVRVSLAVTFLGSSAWFGTPDRAASGYLIEFEGTRFIVDMGGGTWRNLQGQIDYRTLDGIILTHRHPDHTIDVFQAFHARHYGQPDPLPPIPLWAPQETIDRITGYTSEISESFDIKGIGNGDSFTFGPCEFGFVKMAHPPETLGVRVDSGGRSVAYSADCGPTSDFEQLAGGVDLFICEATFQDSDESWEGHMSASQAGSAAHRVGAKRLILTHLPPGRDLGLSLTEAVRVAGDVETRLGADGLRVEV